MAIFLNGESTCNLTDVPASIYDKKTRRLDTILDILLSLSFAQALFNGRNAPASGTERLRKKPAPNVCFENYGIRAIMVYQSNCLSFFEKILWETGGLTDRLTG